MFCVCACVCVSLGHSFKVIMGGRWQLGNLQAVETPYTEP